MYIAISSLGVGVGNPTPSGHGPDCNVCTKYLGSVSLIIKLERHIHLEICQTNYISDLAICYYYQIITVILTKTNVRQKVVRMLLNIIRLVMVIDLYHEITSYSITKL